MALVSVELETLIILKFVKQFIHFIADSKIPYNMFLNPCNPNLNAEIVFI